MGLLNTILGEGSSRKPEEYIELSAEGLAVEDTDPETEIRITSITGKTDLIDIKDEVYNGNIVLADIKRHTTKDRTMEQITDELKRTVQEVDGDIVQKNDEQLIITPSGVRVNREHLGS